MTFLELCQRLRQEVGAAGAGPASVTAQSGEYARLVSWIQQAWREIQSSRHHWRFDWAQASVPVVTDFRNYSPPADLDRWDPETITCNGHKIAALPWSEFRESYEQGSGQARPNVITQSPDLTLWLDAPPERDGQIAFDYWRTPQPLAESGDTPRLPERYHMVIVYRAMLYYGLFENAPEVVQAARSGESRIIGEMELSELPGIQSGGPIA